MKTTIYKLLDYDARRWWYHKQLRDNGQTTEARKRERQSIRSTLETLRSAYFFTVGLGGWSIHCRAVKKYGGTCKSTRSGYGGVDAPDIQACIALGIPGYDVTVPAEDHTKTAAIIRAPMVSDTPDQPDENGRYGGMSYAPVSYVLQYYADLGATIYNAPQ